MTNNQDQNITFLEGDYVYFNHPIVTWSPGKIIKIEETRYKVLYHCILLNPEKEIDAPDPNEVSIVTSQDLYPYKQDSFGDDINGDTSSMDNLLALIDLHEATLLQSIEERFYKDEIHTWMGNGLILTVNPFKWTIPWVQESEMEKYINKSPNLRPSSWIIADDAFRDMLENKNNHSILISGISGAGKTEACKSVIRYLNRLSLTIPMKSSESESASKISSMVEQSSPILEAFGNATTINNDNSSRFGKFIKLLYDRDTIIQGAYIENYLLETSRLISPGNMERSFHIFYQLLASDPEYPVALTPGYPSKNDLIQMIFLEGYKAEDFPNLNFGHCTVVESIDDKMDFRVVMGAFHALGFSSDDINILFRILGALLHLQLVKFEEQEDTAKINGSIDDSNSSLYHLEISSKLLGIDCLTLQQGFITKTIQVPKSAPIISPINCASAAEARDAFIKHIYSNTFNWIVSKINQKISPGANKQSSFIGILDIFGFELFPVNSFEQFCINFANESLQHHYNEHNFKNDMNDCKKEGIDVTSVKFYDNSPCISLISGSQEEGQGILDILDDQCNFPRSTDQSFLNAIIKEFHEKKPDFLLNKARQQSEFIINHYSAKVDYNVSMWLDKNKDRLKDDLHALIKTSSIPLIASLIPEPTKVRGKVLTLGGQFKRQLSELLDEINKTNPAWIRCIKSHSVKKPSRFHRGEVIDQLRSSGVLETVKMRREGFSVRIPLQQFVSKYRFLISRENSTLGMKEKCQCILDKGNLDNTQGQIGKTKVFIRASAFSILNQLRTKCLHDTVIVIQKFSRMHAGMILYKLAQQEKERIAREKEEMEARLLREEQERLHKEEEEKQRKLREEEENLRREEEERQRLIKEKQERIDRERKEAADRLRMEREKREQERHKKLEEERKRQQEMEIARIKLLEDAKQRQLDEERRQQELLEKKKKLAEEERRRKEEELRLKREKIELARKKAVALAEEKKRIEAERIAAAEEERLRLLHQEREKEMQELMENEQKFQMERQRIITEEKERFQRHIENERLASEMSNHKRQLNLIKFKKNQERNRKKIRTKLERERQEKVQLKKFLRSTPEYDRIVEISAKLAEDHHQLYLSPNESQQQTMSDDNEVQTGTIPFQSSRFTSKTIETLSQRLSPKLEQSSAFSPYSSYRLSEMSLSPKSNFSDNVASQEISPEKTNSPLKQTSLSNSPTSNILRPSTTVGSGGKKNRTSPRFLKREKIPSNGSSQFAISPGMFSSELRLSKIYKHSMK